MSSDPKPGSALELALIKKHEAEAAKFEAEAHLALTAAAENEQETRRSILEARDFGIDLRQKERIERELLALDSYNHVYRFNSSVDDSSVKAAIDKLTYWKRTDGADGPIEIEIIFNSPGGNVIAGMDLFDYIQELRREGHTIITSTRGMAASMGGILLQAGTRRIMGREAYVLLHEVSTAAFGKIGEIEDEVKFVRKISDRVLDIFAARCKQAGENGTAVAPLTRAQLKSGWTRRDWWLDSEECLRAGLVDELR